MKVEVFALANRIGELLEAAVPEPHTVDMSFLARATINGEFNLIALAAWLLEEFQMEDRA